MNWTLDDPIEMRDGDKSGAPTALVELARRACELVLVDNDEELDILIEYPMLDKTQREFTGYKRFVKLRTPVLLGTDHLSVEHYATYALIRT